MFGEQVLESGEARAVLWVAGSEADTAGVCPVPRPCARGRAAAEEQEEVAVSGRSPFQASPAREASWVCSDRSQPAAARQRFYPRVGALPSRGCPRRFRCGFIPREVSCLSPQWNDPFVMSDLSFPLSLNRRLMMRRWQHK